MTAADTPKMLEDELLAFGQKIESASRIDMYEVRVIHRAYAEITRLRAELDAARRPVSDEDVEAVARAMAEEDRLLCEMLSADEVRDLARIALAAFMERR